MTKDKIFPDGMIFKQPRAGAPSYIIGALSIKADEFAKFIEQNQKNGWVNIDLKVSQQGKYYSELNTWQPGQAGPKVDEPVPDEGEEIQVEDIPI